MPRNEISDDPKEACHVGLHVGAMNYVGRTYSGSSYSSSILLICKVDPEHVVCVPYDANSEKMRVCKYVVMGHYGSELPSTTFKEEEPKELDEEFEDEDIENEIDEDAEIDDFDNDVGERVTEAVDTADRPKAKKEFKRFTALDVDGLMKVSIEELRRYAFKGLDIIGASKIPGGKVALIQRITAVRGH